MIENSHSSYLYLLYLRWGVFSIYLNLSGWERAEPAMRTKVNGSLRTLGRANAFQWEQSQRSFLLPRCILRVELLLWPCPQQLDLHDLHCDEGRFDRDKSSSNSSLKVLEWLSSADQKLAPSILIAPLTQLNIAAPCFPKVQKVKATTERSQALDIHGEDH